MFTTHILFHIVISVYIGCNCFLFGKDYDNIRDEFKKWKAGAVFTIICYLLLGAVFYLMAAIIGMIIRLLRYIENLFQLRFFFDFYVRHKYDKLETKRLKEINAICKNLHRGGSVRDIIWRHCAGLVNKRNNYTKTQ